MAKRSPKQLSKCETRNQHSDVGRRAGLAYTPTHTTPLTHDREHRETTVLELLKLKLGERDRVVGVGVPRLSKVAELSRRLQRREKPCELDDRGDFTSKAPLSHHWNNMRTTL